MHIELVDIVVRVALVLATSFLFGTVLLAYLRLRNRKLLFVSIGFGIFFIHALIYVPELIWDEYRLVLTENTHLLIHSVGLVFIALGILKD